MSQTPTGGGGGGVNGMGQQFQQGSVASQPGVNGYPHVQMNNAAPGLNGVNQQQMAMLQQMAQARNPGQQWTTQQIQAAMAAMQQQGVTPQGFTPVYRNQIQQANAQSGQMSQMGQQGGQMGQQGGQMGQQGGQMGQHGNQMGQHGNQMGQPAPVGQMGQMGQMGQNHQFRPRLPPQNAQYGQQMQQQGGQMPQQGSQQQQQPQTAMPNQSPVRPPSNPMYPQPQPVQSQGGYTQQSGPSQVPAPAPNQPQYPKLTLTNLQQQQFHFARNNLMTNPAFQAMTPAEKQQNLIGMQAGLMRIFAQQNGVVVDGQPPPPPRHQQQQSQGGQPSQQTPQGQISRSDSGQIMQQGHPQQSPSVNRQHLPGQGQPQQPLSSLPQHMAPARPGSAASHRTGSPHAQPNPMGTASPMQYNTATPPPQMVQQGSTGSQLMQGYQGQLPYHTPTPQPQNAGSPSASVHSHHSYHTPQPHHVPSPMHAATPTPAQPSPYPPVGLNNQASPYTYQNQQNPMSAQGQSQPSPSSHGRPTPGQQGPMPSYPHTSQHQQQPSPYQTSQNTPSAMSAGQLGPSQTPNTATMQSVDPSEFPFDYRLIPMFPKLQDHHWRRSMEQENPLFLQMLIGASSIFMSQKCTPEIRSRMQETLVRSGMHQSATQGGFAMRNGVTAPVVQMRPPGMGSAPPSAAQVQQQMAQAQAAANQPQTGRHTVPWTPAAVAGPSTIPPSARPPHLNAGPSDPPATPGTVPNLARRGSGKDRMPPATAGPQTSMPPPTWIPAADAQPKPPQPPDAPSTSRLPVKEWEGHLSELPITNITPLPEESDDPTFGGRLPALSQEDMEDMKRWQETEKGYVKGLDGQKARINGKLMKWARNNDLATPWWQFRKGEPPRRTGARLHIIWPQEKRNQRARTSHRGHREVRFTPAQLKSMANVEDHIIPVRVDLEHDQWKVKDTFMWNVSDTVVTPELFARSLCEDFGVPETFFISRICAAIRERVREFQDQVLPVLDRSPDGLKGKLAQDGDEASKTMYHFFRKLREGSVPPLDGEDAGPSSSSNKGQSVSSEGSDEVKTEAGDDTELSVKIVDGDGMLVDHEEPVDDEVMTVEEAMSRFGTGQGEDLRVLIRVDIIVGTQNLSDTFEWDLNSTVSPEEFAESHCRELGLNGEFATALAHDIHEQIIVHKRSLFLVGHMPGSGIVQDDEVRSAFLPPLTESSVVRREDLAMSTFTPIFANFSQEEILDIERERERDSKRRKRTTRARRGILLPDRDPIKTHRTLLNPIGPSGVIPTQATEPSAPVATTSRRAAAIAAQAHITELAQDVPSPPSSPPAPAPLPKPRGRPPGRFSRGESRASPYSAREGSLVNGEVSTPVAGVKRAYREDSTPGGGNDSPAPSKRRNNIIENPETEVKLEEAPSNLRCVNCGIPEQLSGGMRREPKTKQTIWCVRCYRYYHKTRRIRPVDYTEDEAVHRQRLGSKIAGVSSLENGNGIARVTNSSALPDDEDLDSPTSSVPSFDGGKADEKLSTPSPSESDSDDSRSDRKTPAPVTSVTPARTASASGPSVSPGTAKKPSVEMPAWMQAAQEALRQANPLDRFMIIPKAPLPEQTSAQQEWRIKCIDCPGKVYNMGPGESLSNFAVHLKNRGHMERRTAARLLEKKAQGLT